LQAAFAFGSESGIYNFAANNLHGGFSNGEKRQKDNTRLAGRPLHSPGKLLLGTTNQATPTRLRAPNMLA
jgi:hypothetical protein